jgi:competence protein ComEA
LFSAAVVSIALRLTGLPCAAQQTLPRVAAATQTRQDLLDINTATPEQLKALPGMGDEYVRRIIAGRPYSAKNQLIGRGVLPPAAYNKIAGQIIAHRPK